ncbi:hypothetical protein L1049_004412 [Liquidambar formosana]|uniref:Uncharacterized protein n=1 Tax=Liquidambar formosana TaxID=63359 RepID=A0AAP0RSV0_LIQFO
MLLSVSNIALKNASMPEDAISTNLCFLPMQTHIYIWYLSLFVITLLALLFWPTNGMGFWHYFSNVIGYARRIINCTFFRGGTKEKNEDENCEYEMIWDAEGSMHLVKKILEAPFRRSSQRGLVERGNAVIRQTTKKQISQETEVFMTMDVNANFGLDGMVKLPPRTSKSKARKVTQGLVRTMRILTVIAVVNVPLYMMLLFKDWIDQ